MAFSPRRVLVLSLLGVTLAVPLVAACGKRAEKRPWTLADCNDAAHQAESEVVAAAGALDASCREQADCTSESNAMCGHYLSCSGIVPVAKAALPALTAARGKISADRCKRMDEAECPRIFGVPPVTSCTPPTPRCIRGRCVLSPPDLPH